MSACPARPTTSSLCLATGPAGVARLGLSPVLALQPFAPVSGHSWQPESQSLHPASTITPSLHVYATGVFSKLAAGDDHACAILADGTATCWGGRDYGKSYLPQAWGGPNVKFSAIAPGSAHTCAVAVTDAAGNTAPGRVICWGRGSEGQTTPPMLPDEPGAEWVDVNSGAYYSCGIFNPGRKLRCWGTMSKRSTTFIAAAELEATGMQDEAWDSIACGENFAYGILRSDYYPVVGFGWGPDFAATAVPEALRNEAWWMVAAGQPVVCGTTMNDGGSRAWIWEPDREPMMLPDDKNYYMVSAQYKRCCVLEYSGKPHCGNEASEWLDLRGKRLADAVLESVAVGYSFACGIFGWEAVEARTASCWGDNSRGQLVVPAPVPTAESFLLVKYVPSYTDSYIPPSGYRHVRFEEAVEYKSVLDSMLPGAETVLGGSEADGGEWWIDGRFTSHQLARGRGTLYALFTHRIVTNLPPRAEWLHT